MVEECILLGFVKPVNLINKENGLYLAWTIIFLISFTPESTAEILTKSDWVSLAMIPARIILPYPGGPHKIIEKPGHPQ
jgi:hypothetical protein